MHLRIVSKPFSLSGKKNIFLDGEPLYYAITDEIAGQACVKLINKKDDTALSIIIRESGLFADSYTIRFLNRENIPIPFKRMERWKNNYEGTYNANTYTVTENKHNVYSITENGNEIARWLKQQKFFSGNEDNFEIAGDLKDIHVVLSLCLIVHEKESNKRGPD